VDRLVDLVPILLIGFIAGMVSGALIGGPATGYIASIVVGVAGALVAGWADAALGLGGPSDIVSVILLATVGSVGVRLALRWLAPPRSGSG
jgi:uncharacterized membrane protein YeaQ/YmgE (transglycosylase-associated protein family)